MLGIFEEDLHMCPNAQLSGLHSRSEELIEVTRAYDRGQTDWSEASNLIDRESIQIIDLQKKLGFDYISDGALSWQDPLRPLTGALNGVSSGTRYSRWFDTNTFYQKPTISGEVSLGGLRPDAFIRLDLSPGPAKWKVSLPGPYTFSELSENKFYPRKTDLVLSIARAEREIIQRLASAGVSLIQLAEPCLVYRPYREEAASKAEMGTALNALGIVADNSPAKIAVQTFFGDATPVLQQLLELPVDAVGFDLYATDYSQLNVKSPKKIILGIVDSRESHVEDPEWISKTATLVSKHVRAPDWVFSPNSDLKYLPRNVADAKTKSLAEAARIFQEAN